MTNIETHTKSEAPDDYLAPMLIGVLLSGILAVGVASVVPNSNSLENKYWYYVDLKGDYEQARETRFASSTFASALSPGKDPYDIYQDRRSDMYDAEQEFKDARSTVCNDETAKDADVYCYMPTYFMPSEDVLADVATSSLSRLQAQWQEARIDRNELSESVYDIRYSGGPYNLIWYDFMNNRLDRARDRADHAREVYSLGQKICRADAQNGYLSDGWHPFCDI